jgi:hypothetical protein
MNVLNQNRRCPMSMSSHISELQKKHEELSERVELIQRRPGSDDLEIASMKKEKLRLKEKISRLRN